MPNYIFTGVLAVLLLLANIKGLDGLYFQYPWYDIPMHILGGIVLGLFIYQISNGVRVRKMLKPLSLSQMIIVVLLIGVSWEIFEIVFNLLNKPFGSAKYIVDTVKDLLDDIIGGIIGIYIAKAVNLAQMRFVASRSDSNRRK